MDFSRYRTNNRRPAKNCGRVLRFLTLVALTLPGLGTVPALWAANPGYDRPGYGFTPAVLRAGDITLEQGLPDWSLDRHGDLDSAQYSADSLLRIGIGGPLELQLGTSPWNALRQTDAGYTVRSSGRGDSVVGMKLALPSTNVDFNWGLLGSMEFTDGAPAFRSTRRQYLLGAQLNLQMNARHSLGVYLQDVRSGGVDSTTLAISDNIALSDTLTLYVEAATLHAQRSGNISGIGLTWLLTSRVQLDAGFDHRLGGTAPEWQTNLGIAVYFGH